MKRAGFVIFVVLITVIAMAAGLTALLSGVRGQSETVRAIVDRQESRFAARSAALAIGAEIEDQLDQILAGDMPKLVESDDVILYEDGSSWNWQVEMAGGEWSGIEPLGNLLDINHSKREVVAAVLQSGGESASNATHHALRTYGMIEQQVVDPERLSMFTVSSADPPLRTGAGGQQGATGQSRINPGEGGEAPSGLSADGIKLFNEIATGAITVSNRSELFRSLSRVPTEDWDVLLDVFGFSDTSMSRGLIDISRAPESVIAALPGIDEENAALLVEYREGITAQDLSGLSWPVRYDVIELEDYMQCVDLLTTRSMQYRVRFKVDREIYESVNLSLGYESEEDQDPPVYGRYDMVVDLSTTRARVAYLRDITFEPWVLRDSETPSFQSSDEETVTELPDDTGVFKSDIQPSTGRRNADNSVESDEPAEDGAGVQWGRYPAGGQG